MTPTSSAQVLPSHGLYVITDTHLLPGEKLFNGVEKALLGGAAVVQYRNKDASHAQRLAEATKLQTICHQYDRPLIINDDIQLAAASGASGVHLGQSDGSLRQAREQLGNHAIIGVTCHGRLELALKAAQEGASYLAFGRFFTSKTKPNALPANLEVITNAKQATGLPTVAIGGINLDNAPQVIEAGADFLAVIHGVFGQENIQEQSYRFTALYS
ncbi:thiamine phosphate synthase [Hahella ganghwensis]|uniref:thiamine phosphate synthase n=1 Tax=Hahella ganghwensis TaxID=286420 RepID=UPI000366CA7F|nr:thiamine phosphate synthase [Hahella ganghwensis]